MKTIGIIGSRRRNSQKDYELLERKFLEIYEDGDRIVSGGCSSGGDLFAEIIAKKYQIPILIHYAQWNKLGKRAGFIRNTDIAKDADVLIALVAKDRTGGAENTINKACSMGKKVVVIDYDVEPLMENPETPDIPKDIFSV